jgi:hypothetical protein
VLARRFREYGAIKRVNWFMGRTPMKILHLIHSLDYGGDARRLSLLAPALAANGSHVEICCLGGETPWAASLRAAGVPVHILGWTRWLDFSVFWNLRELLNDRCADVIHVWGLPALRALAIVAKRFLSRAVICEPLAGERKWYDGQLLKQVRVMPFVAITQNRGPSSLKNGTGDFVLTSVGRLPALRFSPRTLDAGRRRFAAQRARRVEQRHGQHGAPAVSRCL